LAETNPPPSQRRGDRSPWNWLLAVPVVVPLMTFLFNGNEPRLAGFPFFYWIQLVFIALGVVCTAIVYLMTRETTRNTSSGPADPKEG
jgi:uncharacterized membrane protein YhaH (DUF805 family)